jgi:hypothetical protein
MTSICNRGSLVLPLSFLVVILVAIPPQSASAADEGGFTHEEMAEIFKADKSCRLTFDAAPHEVILVRFRDMESGKFFRLPGEIERLPGKMEQVGFWYPLKTTDSLDVPRRQITIESCRGITTHVWSADVDLRTKPAAKISVALKSFYQLQTPARKLASGNTHLHLMRMTHREAIRYLQIVPQADDLDLVYLSHLRRIPDEQHYISNQIVEDGLRTSPQRIVPDGVLFGLGEEHRHNFGRGGEGFGHVMLLDIVRLIRPVSIGPGIMRTGTDSVPLNRGIRQARDDQATVVWCHNGLGFEDHANHLLGHTDALNIFDGGNRGSYEQSHYRYYDLSIQLPMSTGTDWFVYDFSRVHVPIEGELTSKKWLASLRAGKSTITNGPILDFQVDGRELGTTLDVADTHAATIVCKAVGRSNFGKLQLIHNGQVVEEIPAEAKDELFRAEKRIEFEITEPGWLALRVAPDKSRTNLLGQPIFAHTSPVYITYGGETRFELPVAREMLAEIQGGMNTVRMQARFGSDKEKDAVLSIYREAAETLRKRIAEVGSPQVDKEKTK